MEIKYRAINKNGEVEEEIYLSNDIDKLKAYLLKEDLFLIEYEVVKLKKKKISLRELYEFTFNLYRLNVSGIDLIGSLKLVENNYSKYFNDSIQRIISSIETGFSFSDSLKKEDEIYPNTFSYLIKIGEESGSLDKILYELSNMFKYKYELKEEIKSAIIYPIILLIVCLFILFIMIIFIIPSFLNVFDLGENLPLITKVILKLGLFIKRYYLFIVLLNLSIIYILIKKIKDDEISEYWHKKFLEFKYISDLYLDFTFSNYFNSLGVLLHSGEGIIKSMKYSNDLIKNKYLIKIMDISIKELEDGSSLSDSLSNNRYLKKEVIGILKVGEESGNIESAILNCGELYKIDSSRKLERYVKLIEPLLLIFMSIVIGIIIISVISPIFRIINII